jgi:hypothetical protein
MATTSFLGSDPRMLERMEEDLHTRAASVLESSGILGVRSAGIFSIDDLEALTEETIGKEIVVGAGYEGSSPLELEANAKLSAAPGQGTAAKMVGYYFSLIVAVPSGDCCEVRYNAMTLLTALRLGIHGSQVAGDRSARRWAFQREKAEHSASTKSLLYYSQLWMVALPLVQPL